jgi:hypothetical protein
VKVHRKAAPAAPAQTNCAPSPTISFKYKRFINPASALLGNQAGWILPRSGLRP